MNKKEIPAVVQNAANTFTDIKYLGKYEKQDAYEASCKDDCGFPCVILFDGSNTTYIDGASALDVINLFVED